MNITDTNWDKKYDDCAAASCNSLWYALRTRSNYEKIAAGFLEAKGFEQFLPLCRPAKHQDRGTARSIPLFPGYLFCKFDSRYRTPILSSLGVVAIVAFGGNPAPIDEKEIEAIRQVLGCGHNVEPYPYLNIGQRIRIEKGPLLGLEGILAEKRNWRFVVSIQLIRRSIAVEIDPDSIAPIQSCNTIIPGESSARLVNHERHATCCTDAPSSSLAAPGLSF
jgi:transcription antitermination factor NusG